MSLHLFNTSMAESPSSTHNNTREELSDSESSSSSVKANRLMEELEQVKKELIKSKKVEKDLISQLTQAQDDNDLLKEKLQDEKKSLHKATVENKELSVKREESEEEIADLKNKLDQAIARYSRTIKRLEKSEKVNNVLLLEKSQLEERSAQLKDQVEKCKEVSVDVKQLLEELELKKREILSLRRELVAQREKDHRDSMGIFSEEEDSPDRMIFHQFDRQMEGVNLHQEFMLASTHATATTLCCPFPDVEPLPEALVTSTTQTEVISVADSATQSVPFVRTTSTQTMNAFAPSKVNASTQTKSTVSTQTSYSKITSNPFQPFAASSHTYFDTKSNRGIWTLFVICGLIALFYGMLYDEGRVNITPIVDFFRDGVKFQYRRGMPPH